jgi:vacuolar protein sorting-associated protein 11
MAVGRGGNASETGPPAVPSSAISTLRPEPRRQGSYALADDPVTISTPASPAGAIGNGRDKITDPKRLPSPRPFFAHFVDHLDRFVTFLETLARRRWGQALEGTAADLAAVAASADLTIVDEEADHADQAAVWNTLLELYLSLGSGAHAESLRAKALKLLQSTNLPYDPTHALVLCATRDFTPGLVLLWERAGMHEDVLRFWMDRHADGSDADASAQVVRYLTLYGPDRPALYPLVLRFLTSTPALLSKHREDVGRALEVIEHEKILSPVAVVQVLGRNGVASVGLVKAWLMGRIKEARDEIQTASG